MDTEVIMNYGNILAFIQIAVAFNLGLFYLKKDDRYSTYFQRFIDMLSSSVKETMNKETERKNKNEECKFPILGYPLLDGRQQAPV